MDKILHIADLVVKRIRGDISSGEQQELDLWINESPENKALYDRAADPKQQMEKLEVYSLFNKEKVWTNLDEQLFGTKAINFTPQRILRFAAAIMLPLLVAGGFAWWYLRAPEAGTLAEIDNEIKPGIQKAVLILSDGGTFELGGESSQTTLKDGDASISDENSGLSYASDPKPGQVKQAVYNELRTPRGGGYKLMLADGTRIWLNAGSSLRYPVSFHDSIRQVFLEGEAYLEVAHNGKAFVVSTGNMNTRVLGTSFNVSAYTDDDAFYTTLVEGRVRVELLDQRTFITASTILNPDEQATLIHTSSEISTLSVDASGYISWIQGKMEFHNESLESVMKKLARWYDFEFSFENTKAMGYHFSARLDKNESISNILQMLEMTTDVKFVYRENSIVVL